MEDNVCLRLPTAPHLSNPLYPLPLLTPIHDASTTRGSSNISCNILPKYSRSIFAAGACSLISRLMVQPWRE